MPSTAGCSGSPTRSSSSRRATSSCPPRTGRGCSSGASSTRHRRTSPGPEPALNGLASHVHAACRRGLERQDVRQRLHRALLARDLRLHPDELVAAAVLADAQPDPALPLRRLRAVPPRLPSAPPCDWSDRPLADAGPDLPDRDRSLPHLDPRPLPLKERTDGTHTRRDQTPDACAYLLPRLQGRAHRPTA